MSNYQGGTQKRCPKCEAYRVVRSLPPSSCGAPIPGQRVYRPEYEDLHYFRRGLQCQTCWHKWLSAEVPETLIHELVGLRNELRDIKENTEAHTEESEYGSLRLLSGD